MKISVVLQSFMIVLVVASVLSSCKNKKKLTSVSDTAQVSEELKNEMEDSKDEEEGSEYKPEASIAVKLENYFDAIASASSLTSANSSIREASSMFSSSDAPVLIIFYAADGKEEYDEPTTISKYLNYLKDVKKSPNRVEDYTLDSNGKIKDLVLFKK